MFTGIIENTGKLIEIQEEGRNKHLWIESSFVDELKVDQSIAHNGVCLTVTEISNALFKVTAIHETLKKTNLNYLKKGDLINLERCLKFDGRLDGHIVQGHVDQTGSLKSIENFEGSWVLEIEYDEHLTGNITIPKGSICLNGVSLTVVDSAEGCFSVAIIPYTWEHTNLRNLAIGDTVNLEFDVIGKYVQRLLIKNK